VSYIVIFTPQVNRDIVDYWIESLHQREMTRAIDDLVRQMRNDPLEIGESRGGNRRVVFQWPVGMEFEVDEENQQVEVYNFWNFQRRSE
jgi:hypothetical protein